VSVIALTPDDFARLAAAYHATRKLSRSTGIEAISGTAEDRALGFSAIWDAVRPRTLLDPFRGLVLARLLRRSADLAGDVIECGAARGGGAALLALAARSAGIGRRVFVADRFDGLPEPDRRYDRSYRAGQFASSRAEVGDFLAGLGLAESCPILDGDFAATLPRLPPAQRFALVHLDGDLYASTATALAALYPRVVPGGAVVFDDFYDGSGGVLAAAAEFLERSGELLFLGPTGQCRLVKGCRASEPQRRDRLLAETAALGELPAYRAFLASCLPLAEGEHRAAVAYLAALAGAE